MQQVLNGDPTVIRVGLETLAGDLNPHIYNRVNDHINDYNYPVDPARFCKGVTVSKSGMQKSRCLTFAPGVYRGNFYDIFEYGNSLDGDPATVHDGREFVKVQAPTLAHGEIVIGFPGQLRQCDGKTYVPLLIISPKEIAWDEAEAKDWETHWFLALIMRFSPEFYPAHFHPKRMMVLA